MSLSDVMTAIRQWVPFLARTIVYGMVSCFLGPFTRNHSASLWAMRRWCIASTAGLNITVEVSGQENVPKTGPFIYCANHQSLMDILVLGSVLPGDFKWAAKRSLMYIPFLGWHLWLSGHVPVDRGVTGKAAKGVLERFIAVLKSGKALLIFPEGTRTLDGELKEFKGGAFKAAIRGNAPVVPVALDGTFRMLSKGDVRAENCDKVVQVRIGTPVTIPPNEREAVRVTALREQSRVAIVELLASIRSEDNH